MPLSHTPLQQAIHWLFECWWRRDLKGKEELGWTAFLVCLENTVTLEKPVLEPLYNILIKYKLADHLIFYIVDEMFMLFGHIPRSVRSEGSVLYERCFSVWTLHLREGSRSLILSSSVSSGPLILNKKRFVYMCLWAHTFETLFSTVIYHFYITVCCSFFRGSGSLPSFFLGTTTSFG